MSKDRGKKLQPEALKNPEPLNPEPLNLELGVLLLELQHKLSQPLCAFKRHGIVH